jgi:class 3 adenylate cyclase
MTETRRLAAILAADVAGYSRLMGLDKAGTARALDHGCWLVENELAHGYRSL